MDDVTLELCTEYVPYVFMRCKAYIEQQCNINGNVFAAHPVTLVAGGGWGG